MKTSFRRLLPLAVMFAGACTDAVVDPASRPPVPGVPGRPITLQEISCVGSLADETVTCTPPPGAPSAAGGEIHYGGQNLYVKLTSSNPAYNSGSGQFTFDVTVQNLIEQPIGTTDGTTLDPNGVRVFFGSGPTVTGGTGSASVVPDGFATFTAAGQAFYQYNSLLTQGQTSGTRTWTLIMPPTVTTFAFVLYVASPVEYPDGYITLDGELPEYSYGYMHPGDSHPLAAVAKTAVGNAIPGAVMTFGTTDPNCATVSPTGTVTGVRYATCTITVSSGPLAGSMSFDVSGTTRGWSGATSADWNVATNWSDGFVPATADSVLIPVGVPNFPVLTSAVTISNVTVADLATLDLASFNLTSTGDLATGATAGSGVLSSGGGLLVLTGPAQTIHGRFPSALVTGTYSLDGDYHGNAPEMVDSGLLISESYNLLIEAQ